MFYRYEYYISISHIAINCEYGTLPEQKKMCKGCDDELKNPKDIISFSAEGYDFPNECPGYDI